MRHPNADVRLAAIDNDLINTALLAYLAKNQDHYVRYSVAIYPLTCKSVLSRLALDDDSMVRKGVNENINYY
jgi:hypothetical protein